VRNECNVRSFRGGSIAPEVEEDGPACPAGVPSRSLPSSEPPQDVRLDLRGSGPEEYRPPIRPCRRSEA
jgi:hypothetical protein